MHFVGKFQFCSSLAVHKCKLKKKKRSKWLLYLLVQNLDLFFTSTDRNPWRRWRQTTLLLSSDLSSSKSFGAVVLLKVFSFSFFLKWKSIEVLGNKLNLNFTDIMDVKLLTFRIIVLSQFRAVIVNRF